MKTEVIYLFVVFGITSASECIPTTPGCSFCNSYLACTVSNSWCNSLNQCVCWPGFEPYPPVGNLQRCFQSSREPGCITNIECTGLHQECRAGKCACKFASKNMLRKRKFGQNLQCQGPSCQTNSDCTGSYQVCWKGECVCKYSTITKGKEDITKCKPPSCQTNSDCTGSYQECWKGECVCKYSTITKGKEDITKCKPPSCQTNSDCTGSYQECWKGECVCKYSTITKGKEDITKCKPPNYCEYYDHPCPFSTMWCAINICECNSDYRTLTDTVGRITECYNIKCKNNNECGVFETCKKGKCDCVFNTQTITGHNTTCVGPLCLHDSHCGEFQKCSDGRCACKYGMITRNNRTSVCVNPYSCIDDVRCGLNGHCLRNLCTCSNGYQSSIGERGTFTCTKSEDKVLSMKVIAAIGIGSGAVVVLGIIVTFGCVRRYRRRRQAGATARPSRIPQRTYFPSQLSASTVRLLNSEPAAAEAPPYEYHNNPYKPEDWPPEYADQPPSYEVAMGLTATHS